MRHKLTETEVTLTATLEELATWQSNGLAVYATPAQDDHAYAVRVYVGSRPNFMYDFCVAIVQDFLDVEGWDSLELEDNDPTAGDTISCTVSRRKEVIDGRVNLYSPQLPERTTPTQETRQWTH